MEVVAIVQQSDFAIQTWLNSATNRLIFPSTKKLATVAPNDVGVFNYPFHSHDWHGNVSNEEAEKSGGVTFDGGFYT